MAFAKRIVLFLLTNILILVTISIVLQVLGIQPYLTRSGLDYDSLMRWCLIWGMGGAFISLQLSRFMAKMFMGIKVIDSTNPGQYAGLVNMVSRVANTAGLAKVPEIGIYNSSEPNAFATGPSQRRALVAFSSGILSTMTDEELEGVTAHEITHIVNGDMVTMTLLQGVINAFVMFFARVIAFAISNAGRSENERSQMNYLIVFLLEIVLGLLGSLLVAWFSRQREFRADAGSAKYVGRGKMIAALQRLGRVSASRTLMNEPASIAMLKISGKPGGYRSLFASHPPIEERIARLQQIVS